MSAGTEKALVVSLAWAVVLQVVAYALIVVARRRRRLMLGWAGGAAVRLLGLVVYALAVVPALGLSLVAALLSLVVFLFVSTMIESYLLTRVAT